MRPLYLHIGLHKTGTSYLQRLLYRNRDRLAAAGLGLAPFLDPLDGSHHPVIAALDAEGPGPVFDRVAEAPGARVLLSSEELSSRLLDQDFARALQAAAARHFEPHVVLFLRRQDFLKESAFAEIVKDWYAGDIRDDHHYVLDHAARVADLEAVFGPGRVHVALYRDPGPNDIVGDLLAMTGTDLDPKALKGVPPQNVSMHRRKTLFLAGLPKFAEATTRAEDRVAPRFVARVVSRSDAIADDGVRFLLSPAERHALVASHAAANRALVERLAPTNPGLRNPGSFLDLPDPDAPWNPPAPVTPAEIAAARRACLRTALRRRNPLTAFRLTTGVLRLFGPLKAAAKDATRDATSPAPFSSPAASQASAPQAAVTQTPAQSVANVNGPEARSVEKAGTGLYEKGVERLSVGSE